MGWQYPRRDPAPGYCRCSAPNIGGWERGGCEVHPDAMSTALMFQPLPGVGQE